MKEFFIDDSGKLSMGRVLCLIITLAYTGLAVYVTVIKGVITDMPLTAAGLIVSLYAANKFSPTTPFKPPGV